MKMIKTLLSSVALAVGFASVAHAELRIELSGMNIAYNNVTGALFDSGANGGTGGSTGGAGNPGDGDEVIVLFYDGSTAVGFQNGWVDFFLPVDQLAVGSVTTSTNDSGYFDILLSSTNGYGLSVANPVIEAGAFSGNFDLIGAVGVVDASVLPFMGLNVGDPIRLSFSSQINSISTGPVGIIVNSFESQGTGEVSSVPEPAAIALLGLGLLAMGYTRRRRQN